MRFFSFAAAAAVISVASPSLAETSEKQTFAFKGSTYVYTVETKDDTTVVQGIQYPMATSFKLYLHKDRVTGNYGGQSIAFKQSEAKGALNTGAATLLTMR